jgi:Domain of unknown function (DUF4956)
MWEWVQSVFPNGLDVPLNQMFGRLIAAFILGCGVAAIYRWTHRKDAQYSPTFVTTLVLMAVLVAVVTQVIGQNSARAFGLLGALAIVRFRTIVRDTRDTAFVVFAVVEGMAVGAGYLPIALAGFGIAGAAAVIMRPRDISANAIWELKLRVSLGAGAGPAALLRDAFERHLEASNQTAAATGRQGAALDLVYRVRLLPATDPSLFVAELNRLEGVESVILNQPILENG